MKICALEGCEKEIPTRRKYCGAKHRSKYNSLKAAARKKAARKKIECEKCGIMFYRGYGRHIGGCSPRCRNAILIRKKEKAQRKKDIEKGATIGGEKIPEKYLVRGLISGSHTGCPITQNV